MSVEPAEILQHIKMTGAFDQLREQVLYFIQYIKRLCETTGSTEEERVRKQQLLVSHIESSSQIYSSKLQDSKTLSGKLDATVRDSYDKLTRKELPATESALGTPMAGASSPEPGQVVSPVAVKKHVFPPIVLASPKFGSSASSTQGPALQENDVYMEDSTAVTEFATAKKTENVNSEDSAAAKAADTPKKTGDVDMKESAAAKELTTLKKTGDVNSGDSAAAKEFSAPRNNDVELEHGKRKRENSVDSRAGKDVE